MEYQRADLEEAANFLGIDPKTAVNLLEEGKNPTPALQTNMRHNFRELLEEIRDLFTGDDFGSGVLTQAIPSYPKELAANEGSQAKLRRYLLSFLDTPEDAEKRGFGF